MNKKGIECLPLKYLVVALTAAIVIGIILEVTGILQTSITGAVINLNKTVGNATII